MRRVRTIAGCHAALAMAFLAACDPPSRATSDAPASITGSGAPSTAPTRAPDRRIPELDVPRVEDDEVQIDGALDEAAWKRAAIAGPFVDVSTGAPLDERALTARAPVQGSARLLWSEGFLYVAFDIYDTDVRGGFDADAKDPHLWERDTAEVMIDPDGDGDNRSYYEIQINPQNLVFDSHFDAYNQPRGGPAGPFGHEDWSSRVESRVTVRGSLDDDRADEGYLIEARIPWSAFHVAQKAPPEVGHAWRMNFYAMQDNGGTAWSPILGEGNFHKASRFGRVRFAR